MSAKESAAEKRKREKAAAEAEQAAAEAAQLEADNVSVAGAIGRPATPVPENVKTYFDLKLSEILKTLSDQFQVIQTDMSKNMEQVQMDLSTSVSTLQDRLVTVEHKKRTTDVDIKVIQNTIRQLPKSGEIQEYFEERNLNESVVAANLIPVSGDDSLDSSYSSRTSILAKFQAFEYVPRRRENAPDFLKYALVELKGPKNNDNWMNVREATFTEAENAILDKFDVIPSREDFLKALREENEEESKFIKEVFSRGQRWDTDFGRDTPPWDGKKCFEAWFLRFWRIAKRNNIDNPQLFKETLYERVFEARGEALGEIILPENNRSSSALKYYLQLRRLLVPVADPEQASGLFYGLKQNITQPLDMFFQQKLKLFRIMNPASVSKRQWKDFYFNVSKSLMYSDLANDMVEFVDKMTHLDNYSSYLSHLLNRGNYYVHWVDSGHINVANIAACYSTSTLQFVKDNKTEVKKQVVINAVEPEQKKFNANMREALKARKALSTVDEDNGEGSEDEEMPEWLNDDSELPIEMMVAYLNTKARKVICWHCNKDGHMMTDCFSRKAGKPPAPDSRFGKAKLAGGDKFKKNDSKFNSSYNRALPDQFAKAGAAVNQVDGDPDSEMGERSKAEAVALSNMMDDLIRDVSGKAMKKYSYP